MDRRTPGPWTVREVGITEYPANDFHTVCEVRGADGTGVADHILLADAKLIALAPELVTALRNARGFIHLHDKGIAVHEGGLLAEIDAVLARLES